MSSLATAPVEAYQVVPWAQLTRFGIPQFTVCRRAMTIKDVTYAIGDVLPPEVLPHPTRLRQLYQQRVITPVLETVGVTRAHPLKRLFGGRVVEQQVAPVVEQHVPASVVPVELMNGEFGVTEFAVPQVEAEPVEEVEEVEESVENVDSVVTVGSTGASSASATPASSPAKSLSRKQRRNRR